MRSTAGHAGYLLLFGVACGGLCAAILAFACSDFYFRHSRYLWDVIDEYKFHVQDQSAQILFIGDSSLVHGVQPERVRQETGLAAYNLGVSMPALIVEYQQLLDEYLAHNAKPRLLVLYLSATTRSQPPYATDPIWYEGESVLLRHGNPAAIGRFFSGHATEISRFLALAARQATQLDWSGAYYRDAGRSLEEGGGYIAPQSLVPLAAADCPISTAPVQPDRPFIEKIRHEFASRGIAVAVYVAPVPDCDHGFSNIAARYAGVSDNHPYVLPHSLFVADTQRQHLLPPGARQNSEIVSGFVQRFLLQQATAARLPQ